MRAEQARIEKLEAALEALEIWSRSYPLNIFPEPDLKLARHLLESGGISLDAISASNMRHILDSVGEVAREALKP